MIVLVVTTLILLGKSATCLKFHLTPWRQQKLRHSLIIHSEWNLQPVQIGPEVGFRTPHMLRHPGHDPWICQDPEEKKVLLSILRPKPFEFRIWPCFGMTAAHVLLNFCTPKSGGFFGDFTGPPSPNAGEKPETMPPAPALATEASAFA